jgi:primosomal protein N' (replication factor Y)
MFGEKKFPSSFLADVAVPIPIAGSSILSYRVQEAFSSVLTPGMRVIVPVGNRKITGIFVRWSDSLTSSSSKKIKEILDIIDEVPVFPENLIHLWQWSTKYYLTSFGEMLSAMLPGGALRESEIIVRIKKDHTKKKRKLLEQKLTGNDSSLPFLQLIVSQLTPQEQALLAVIQEKKRVSTKSVRRQFPTLAIPSVLQRLEKLHLIESLEKIHLRKVDPFRVVVNQQSDNSKEVLLSPLLLSSHQQYAYERIASALHAEAFCVFLLCGVTGSGKTEIYLQAARKVIERQKRVLFLVPEIALTHQLVLQVRERLGHRIAVLHSAQPASERWEMWRSIARGEIDVVIGARSAVFAPMENLGLIVVDEEHDSAYKQEEGPRYHARDLAIVRGQMTSCPVILGSATPSLESYLHCQTQRYTLLELPERVASRPLPSVEVVDLRRQQRDDNDSYKADKVFSSVLRQALIENYQGGKQSVLFLNRRGYASYLQCRSCGEALLCGQCSVTLTFHLKGRVLCCHYCGFTRKAPDFCPQCQEPELEGSGIGTEQVEEALCRFLPEARVARLDRDSVRKKAFLQRVIESWRSHETDVLIGTQMVTKGHDVPGVTLVGVLLADVALNLPDFRAAERTFQLLTQVAGRAGRGEEPGRVIIQTYSPQHYSIRCAAQHDFHRFATLELRYRKKLGYPPFTRMVNIRFEGTNGERVRETAEQFAKNIVARDLRNGRGPMILGPAPAPIERIKGRERWQLLLRGNDRALLHETVRRAQTETAILGRSSQLRIVVDVDPYNML